MGVQTVVEPESFAVLLEMLTKRKWAPTVIQVVKQADRPLRFGEVHQLIDGLNEQTLHQTLLDLQRDGLIEREAYDERPPRVEYCTTPLGRSFCAALLSAFEWAGQHHAEVLAARQRFDEERAGGRHP